MIISSATIRNHGPRNSQTTLLVPIHPSDIDVEVKLNEVITSEFLAHALSNQIYEDLHPQILSFTINQPSITTIKDQPCTLG